MNREQVTHPVYVGAEKIGRARNWQAAEDLAALKRGGKWKAAAQWRLKGRRRILAYSMRALKTP